MKRFATLLCILSLAAVPAFAGGGHFARAAGAGSAAAANAHFEHLAKALNLTDDQKAAVQPLRDELQATVQPLFTDLHTKHQALRTALQSNADATTVGEAAIAAHAVQTQIKAAHDKFNQAFAALLTPDQQTKLKALQAQHGRGPRPNGGTPQAQ
jgi:Spy/CpxP family protein refolding chaperone